MNDANVIGRRWRAFCVAFSIVVSLILLGVLAPVAVYASESDMVVNKTASSATIDEPGGIVTYTVEITNTSINAITITGLFDTMDPADLSCTVPFTLAGSGVPDLDTYTETFSTTGNFGSNDNEFSGVTYNHSNGNVIIVDDEDPDDDLIPSNLFVYSTTVSTDPMIPVTLTKQIIISNSVGTDIEGIAWMYGTTYAVLTEDTPAKIHIVDLSSYLDGSTITSTQTITITPFITETENSAGTPRWGAEGIAFQFGSATSSATITNAIFYVVKEKSPQTLYEIDGTGTILQQVVITNTNAINDEFDLSDVYYGAANGEIYLISDDSQQVFQLGQPSQINWNAGPIDVAGLPSISLDSYDQAEGLAFDAHQSNFIVVSELGETFGRFTAPPPIGENIICTYTMNITGSPDAVIANTVTVTATGSDGITFTQSADADVTIDDVPSSITVTKTADPNMLPEPGGVVTYTVVISNGSEVDEVTIDALDDTMGVVDLSCTLPVTLSVGGSITCTYTETVNGSAGEVIPNTATVKATDDDGNPINGSDSADVTIDPPPTMSVSKTANPTTIQQSGDIVTYTVLITNTSAVTLTVTDFVDTEVAVNPATICTPAPGTPLAPGDGHVCTYAVAVTGNRGDMITNTVTVTATADGGDILEESAEAIVTIATITPTIAVSKVATPTHVISGTTVTYTVLITNTSAVTLTVTGFADTEVAVDPATICTPDPGTPLAPGDGHVCTYAVVATGDAGDVITNTVTVTATDGDGDSVSGTDAAAVTIKEDCDLCIHGASKVTIELVHRDPHGDRHERIRVRTLDGTVLFDTYDDGNPYGHNGLYEGESFTVHIPDPGEEIVITVQGRNHRHETVKARFDTDCGLAVGDRDGNSYIKFEVIEIVTDNADQQQCEDPDPPAEPCELCVDGASQVTIELVHRASHGDQYERIRVRQSDGTVLFDTYYDGDPYGHYGLFVGESFTITVPNPGEELMITVQGHNHRHETVKAWFDTDCGLAVGDQDGNSYIKFEVIAIVTDSADQCEDDVADSVRVVRSAVRFLGELDVSLFMPDPEMPVDEAIDENGEIIPFSADYSGDMIFVDVGEILSDYNGDVIIIDMADTIAPEAPTAVTLASQIAWMSSMSVILFAVSLLVCTTAVTRRF